MNDARLGFQHKRARREVERGDIVTAPLGIVCVATALGGER
jgi:hypothetical protein